MITYNFTYRGPLTYDKYALNILQMHNEVRLLKEKTIKDGEIKETVLKDLKNKFDSLYTNITNNSLSEQLFIVHQYLN